MRIGVDFDNTIVCYDGVFYKTAIDLGWIPKDTGQSKKDVKQFFLDTNTEPKWTELQGIVYGDTIKDASIFPGLKEVISQWRELRHDIFLVSHKTQYPIIGEKLNFHDAANSWLHKQEVHSLFDAIYFCPQKDKKLAKISELQLDWFIDDLPSILEHELFPERTQRCLFEPQGSVGKLYPCAMSWLEVGQIVR